MKINCSLFELAFCRFLIYNRKNEAYGDNFTIAPVLKRSNMTARERCLQVFEGKTVDRLPNFNIIMGFSAAYCGKTYRQYVSDHRVLCECDLRCAEDFRLDILSAISDPMREAKVSAPRFCCPRTAYPTAPRL